MGYDLKTEPVVTSGLTDNSLVFGAKDGQSDARPDPISAEALWQYTLEKIESDNEELQEALGIEELAQSAADSAAAAAAAAASAVEVTGALPRVDRTTLKALDTDQVTVAYLTESGREGMFLWRSGDHSSHIAADTAEGVYIKANAVEATSGAWERVHDGSLHVRWFGAAADGVTDDSDAVQAAINLASMMGLPVRLPRGTLLLGRVGSAQVTHTSLTKDLVIQGEGVGSKIKRGDEVIDSSNDRMFLLSNASGTSVSIELRDFFIDGNARKNGLPLTISDASGTFEEDETISNGSGVTARITKVVSSTELRITAYTTGFSNGDTITGQTSGATATVPTAPDPYVWQQSHCIRLGPNDARGFTNIVIHNVEGYDATADVVSIAGDATKTVDRIQVSKFRASGRERVRSDLVITAGWDELNVSDCEVDAFEIEPNSIAADHLYDVSVTGIIARKLFDCWAGGARDAGVHPRMTASNLNVRGLCVIGEFDAKISNFDLRLDSALRFIRGRYRMSNGAIFLGQNGASFAAVYGGGLYYTGNSPPDNLLFDNVEFSSDDTAAPGFAITDASGDFEVGETVTGGTSGATGIVTKASSDSINVRAVSGTFEAGETITGGTSAETAEIVSLYGSLTQFFHDENAFAATQEITEFINCRFLGATVKTAFIRSGKFRWDGCVHEYAGAAIEYGPANASNVPNELYLHDNHVSHELGYLFQPPIVGNEVKIRMGGNTSEALGQIINFTRYDKITANRGGADTLLNFITVDEFESASAPTTGKWLKGQRIWKTDVAAGGSPGWICTTSGNGDGSAATGSASGAAFKAMADLAS